MKVYEYLPKLEISRNYPSYLSDNCAVIERTADGKSVGACGFYLKDGVTCPHHGIVRRLSQCEVCNTASGKPK